MVGIDSDDSFEVFAVEKIGDDQQNETDREGNHGGGLFRKFLLENLLGANEFNSQKSLSS